MRICGFFSRRLVLCFSPVALFSFADQWVPFKSLENPQSFFSQCGLLLLINQSFFGGSPSVTNIHGEPAPTRAKYFIHQKYWNNILWIPCANENKDGFEPKLLIVKDGSREKTSGYTKESGNMVMNWELLYIRGCYLFYPYVLFKGINRRRPCRFTELFHIWIW